MALPAFARSRPLTLGVELELQIVNTENFDLTPRSDDLLRQVEGRRIPGELKPEIARSMVEMATGICENHDDVKRQLGEMRDVLVQGADALGLGLSGGGTHPFQDWSERSIHDTPRYQELSRLYGYLAKQFTVFGQHVHVGCPTPDMAMTLLHGLSRYVPHLIALSAASPFVRGVDTSFESARLNSVLAFPLSGHAPFLLTWNEFRDYYAKMERSGIVAGMKDFYWDIRPKPEFGTVEVRVMDTPLSIERAAGLAAYVQCLARHICVERPFNVGADDYLPYTFNRFQAGRFGLDAAYVNPGSGERLSLREAVLQSFKDLESHAIELKADDALRTLRQDILDRGNDASWIRKIFSDTPSLPDLARQQTLRWSGKSAA